MVTAQYLLEGSVYSLEQCGLLLSHAVRLFRTGCVGSFASAIALAAMAREELGKSRLLRGYWRRAVRREIVTPHDIDNLKKDHLKKQREGQWTQQVCGSDADEMRLLLHSICADPVSEQSSRDAKRLSEIGAERMATEPKERHELRMESLYVDPDKTFTAWKTPKSRTQEEALYVLRGAMIDYSIEFNTTAQNVYLIYDTTIYQIMSYVKT